MNLRSARLDAGMTVAQLSRAARIDRKTVEKAEEGGRIMEVNAVKIVKALNEATGNSYTVQSLGINVS